jgi:hypothetical protein
MIRRHFRIRQIVLGLAFAAMAVPVAQAKPVDWQVGSDQPISPAQISMGGGVTPTLAQLETEAGAYTVDSQVGSDQPISPAQISIHGGVTPTLAQLETDAQAYQSQSGGVQSSSHGGVTPTMAQLEAEALRYKANLDSPQNPPVGFDWGDAGLGGSVAFGAMLLLLTSVGLSRRYRSRLDDTGLAST